MWAYVTDNTIQEIIRFPKGMVINDVRHPRAIFKAWSWDELNAVGIYTVEAGTQGDDRFEITSSPNEADIEIPERTTSPASPQAFSPQDNLDQPNSTVAVVSTVPKLEDAPMPLTETVESFCNPQSPVFQVSVPQVAIGNYLL